MRQLVPVRSCLVESTPDGEKPTAIVITQFEGGQTMVHRQDATKIHLQAALDKCVGALKGTTAQPLSLNRTMGNGSRLGLVSR